MRKGLVLGLLLFSSNVASAQSAFKPPTLLFPGSLNVTSGTIAPSEQGNVLTSATAEQGVDVWRRKGLSLVGHADFTVRRDTANNVWNNNSPMVFGLKAVAVGGWGVAQVGVGANVLTSAHSVTRVSRAASASYWTAWRGDRVSGSRRVPNGYPGHVYAYSGYITAAEPDNWISAVRVEQGVSVLRSGQFAAIPFVGVGAGRDTQRFGWNNRTQMDGGIKIARSIAGGVIDVGFAERREESRLTHEARVAPVFFVDMWIGWNARYARGK
jgi:hypothetical protein